MKEFVLFTKKPQATKKRRDKFLQNAKIDSKNSRYLQKKKKNDTLRPLKYNTLEVINV